MTRARVQAAAAHSGFEPNAHARSLRGAGPGIVALAVPSLRDPVWLGLTGGLSEGLIVRGLQPDWVLGTGGSTGEDRVWTRCAARRVTAVLVLGATVVPGIDPAGPSAWGQLCRRGVPVIFVEPTWSTEPDGLTIVRSDHRAAAALVAGYLHGEGHRQVGLRGFCGRAEHRATLLREACAVRGLACTTTAESDGKASRFTPRGGLPPTGSRPTPRRGRPPAAPTAVVTADDLSALRLLCELRAAGRTAPADCSVIGHGDDPAGALSVPALTTLDPQPAQLVARTLELLDEFLRDPGGIRAGYLWITPLLRCRGSVANILPSNG